MNHGLRKIKLLWLMCLLLFFQPLAAGAMMQSVSYRIYETVLEEFDGPAISGVAATAGETTATVGWTTDVTADGFVIYDTVNPFTNPKEQGSSVKAGTGQSVTLVGLTAATTYYYRVKSTGLNGGVTTDSTVRSFTTSASSAAPTPTPQGGGGILIIDKRDKIAPAISQIKVDNIKSDSVNIDWLTDEEANSFVAYGKDANLGITSGQWDTTKNHAVTLTNLSAETTYYFKVLSADASGNLASSGPQTFKTLSLEEEIKQEAEKKPGEAEPSITDLKTALERALEIISRLAGQVSVGALESNLTEHLKALDIFNKLIPGPFFSAEPKMVIEARSATVIWETNVGASSQVAFASAKQYNPKAVESYPMVVGNSEERIKDHQVKLIGLEPDTVYHYQLRSRGLVGPLSKSRDFTFTTKKEELAITSYTIKVITPEEILIRWLTSAETDASVRRIPYRGNSLAVDEAKTISDEHTSLVHEIGVKDLEGGVVYQLELSGKDQNGRVVSQTIPAFSTTKDNLPPVISQVRTDTAISPGKDVRIQVIITWQTNEPATSRVYYQQGVTTAKELKEKTQPDNNYTKRHVVVITKFRPGEVYSFRAESADSGGNTTVSKTFTILAPRQKESIFQIILRILEQTFGWIGTIRG